MQLIGNEIYVNRGDNVIFEIKAKKSDGEYYQFQKGDVVRMNIYDRADCTNVLITKDTIVSEETNSVNIELLSTDTSKGNISNKIVKYRYEVLINPDTAKQTLIGFDNSGEKSFYVTPSAVINETEVEKNE